MQMLVAVTVTAVACLAVRLLGSPPPWLGRVVERLPRTGLADDGEQPTVASDGDGDQLTVEWGLLSQPFIRRRLDALAEELERLDREPDVFAKAFHTMVVRSAQDALVADASRVAHRPWSGENNFDIEVLASARGSREELEL